MRGCIYGKNISLVHGSFMEIPLVDLWAEIRNLGGTWCLPVIKETKGHTALILLPSERAQNSEHLRSLHGSSKLIWDILLAFRISTDPRIGKSQCRHISRVERAIIDSQHNSESAFETLINCMNTRSLACEKKFRFSRTPPYGCGSIEKKYLAFRKNFMQSFTQEGRLIISG